MSKRTSDGIVKRDLPAGVPQTCMRKSRYLDKKNEHPRDTRIYFDEQPHLYYTDWKGDGSFTCERGLSVTTMVKSFFDEFDPDKVIAMMKAGKSWHKNKKYAGKSDEEIKAMWSNKGKDAQVNGTKLHAFIDRFYNNEKSDDPVDQCLDCEVQDFLEFNQVQQKQWEPYRSEWVVFTDDSTRITGSIDMVYVDKEKMDAEWKQADVPPDTLHLVIVDWKRTIELKKFNPWSKGYWPCTMPNTNYFHYTMQLNLYKYILEKFYGDARWNGHIYKYVQVDGLHLCVLHKDRKSNRLTTLRNHQREVEQMMRLREQSFQLLAAGKPQLFPFDKTQKPTILPRIEDDVCEYDLLDS